MSQLFSDDNVLPVTLVRISDSVTEDLFKAGETVKVWGVSKSKGFQGVVKRHGFKGGPKTHGQKNRHRAPGSIGATAPQRVLPGRRMAGRMGGDRVTLKKIKIASWDSEQKILSLKGPLPGRRGAKIELFL